MLILYFEIQNLIIACACLTGIECCLFIGVFSYTKYPTNNMDRSDMNNFRRGEISLFHLRSGSEYVRQMTEHYTRDCEVTSSLRYVSNLNFIN